MAVRAMRIIGDRPVVSATAAENAPNGAIEFDRCHITQLVNQKPSDD
jgi:hypothetical protein